MSMKQATLPLVASAFYYGGLNKFISGKYGGRGVVLMMHGVHKDQEKPINKAGMISAPYLETLLHKIRHCGLTPIRLQDVPEFLKEKREDRFICLSFDDGYKNNLELALPLLEKYEVPATVFITTAGMDGTLEYEWGALEHYLAKAEEIEIGKYKCPAKSLQQKRRAYQKISRAALADYKYWQPEFARFFSKKRIDMAALVRESFLDREGIKVLSASPMIDIGGHTNTHPVLADLSEDQALEEIRKNKCELEQLLEKEVSVFAYPYGGYAACGEREFRLAQQAGYKLAVTTRAGAILDQHQEHLLVLPRFAVNGLYERPRMLDMYFSGSMRALRSGFGSPFVF